MKIVLERREEESRKIKAEINHDYVGYKIISEKHVLEIFNDVVTESTIKE